MIPPSALPPNLNDAVTALNYKDAADNMEYNDYVDPQAAEVDAPVVGGIAVLMNRMSDLVI